MTDSGLGIPGTHGATDTPRLERWNQRNKQKKPRADEEEPQDAGEDEGSKGRRSGKRRTGKGRPSPAGDDVHIDFTA